jgi:hypothetical protein
MLAIALLGAAIGLLRMPPTWTGGWRAAFVFADSIPYIQLLHERARLEEFPRTCNSAFGRCDHIYDVPNRTVVAVTAISAGILAFMTRSATKLRRQRRALTESS